MYQPEIGRWGVTDALADAYFNMSPYGYVANNPIKYVDPDGQIIRDKDGNIVVTTTGEQITTGLQQVSDPVKNNDGTSSTTFISRDYEVVSIFADNGTPIEAFKLVASKQVTASYDSKGKLIKTTEGTVDTNQYDCVADCHGYTFADNNLWINDDQVELLLENDGYARNTGEKNATAAIFKKDGDVVHSAKRNKNGTYNKNAGIMKTEYGVSLNRASRNLTDVTKKSNTEFVSKKSSDRILNTNLGKSIGNGIRRIDDKNEIAQFLKLLR